MVSMFGADIRSMNAFQAQVLFEGQKIAVVMQEFKIA
jgi:hypothetical protein